MDHGSEIRTCKYGAPRRRNISGLEVATVRFSYTSRRKMRPFLGEYGLIYGDAIDVCFVHSGTIQP